MGGLLALHSTEHLWDFLRLAKLKAAEPQAACIFVLAGSHKEIAKKLACMPFRSAEKKNAGIGASGAQKRLRVDLSNFDHIKFLLPTIREFKLAGLGAPISFVTRATELHPLQTDGGTVDFQCMAWELVSAYPECTCTNQGNLTCLKLAVGPLRRVRAPVSPSRYSEAPQSASPARETGPWENQIRPITLKP